MRRKLINGVNYKRVYTTRIPHSENLKIRDDG